MSNCESSTLRMRELWPHGMLSEDQLHKENAVNRLVAALILAVAPSFANAAEYCVNRYESEIAKVSTELTSLLKRQDQIDTRLAAIYVRQGIILSEIAVAAGKVPPDVQTIQKLSNEASSLNREKAELETEGYSNQDRIVALKGVVPADLQGRLRGCIEASAPANKLVNLAIQALAIMSTGGASLALPPKALYVDMSAVLNGYPTGGPQSVINEAREAALNALGLGGNNDVGNVFRDPGRVIRCLSGC